MIFKDSIIRILSLLPRLIICLGLISASSANDPDQKLIDDIRNRFFRDNELLQKYFQDGFLERMDKMMDGNQLMGDEVFKEMQKAFESDPFFDGQSFAGKWVKGKEGMTYLIDGEISEGGKFDVKIKEGQVTIEADVIRKIGSYGTHKSVIKRSFPVPEGCDGEKMKIEPKEGKLAILFPWKNQKKETPKKPLLKSPGDITI